MTALLIACKNGATQLIEKLLEKGANINVTNHLGTNSSPSSSSSFKYKYLYISPYLNSRIIFLSYSSISTAVGKTPLHIAVEHEHFDCAQVLLSLGKGIVVDARDSKGNQ